MGQPRQHPARSAGLSRGLAAFDKALAVAPDLEEALLGRAGILFEQGTYDLAAVAFRRAAAISPQPGTLAEAVNARVRQCDWEGIEDDWAAALAAVGKADRPASPFLILSMPSSPQTQLSAAQAYNARQAPPVEPPIWSGQTYDHERTRIAYVSPDYHNHATSLLAAGLFEHHDRKRFEIIGISSGPDDGSRMRRRVAKAFDRFVDVREMSDEEVARMLRDMESDIVVDLDCYVALWRQGIVARRPAPIQVSYLGYPGTTGSPYH